MLVSDFVQNEIKSNKLVADLTLRINGLADAQTFSRNKVFNEIVSRYPFRELRDCDREIFRSMCMRGKKSLEVIKDLNSLGEALNNWKSKNGNPEKLKKMAQSALSPLNIYQKNDTEILRLLENSLIQAKERAAAVRKSVGHWLRTIKKAIDAREVVRNERRTKWSSQEDCEAVSKILSSTEETPKPITEQKVAEHVHRLNEQQREQLGKRYIFSTDY